jgi:hypothetical protein
MQAIAGQKVRSDLNALQSNRGIGYTARTDHDSRHGL